MTLMLDAGIPAHKVAAHHGHDPAMTLRVYANAKPDEDTALVADAVFG